MIQINITEAEYTYPSVFQTVVHIHDTHDNLKRRTVAAVATFLRVPKNGKYYVVKHVSQYEKVWTFTQHVAFKVSEEVLEKAYRKLLLEIEASRHLMNIDPNVCDQNGVPINMPSKDQTPENERIRKLIMI